MMPPDRAEQLRKNLAEALRWWSDEKLHAAASTCASRYTELVRAEIERRESERRAKAVE
jgi:hypothetical protein